VANSNEDLTRETVMAWRRFAQTKEFSQGMEWLRQHGAPSIDAEGDIATVKAAAAWKSYMGALKDVEEKLTFIKAADKSSEQPGLTE